jgi:hypothetical protein
MGDRSRPLSNSDPYRRARKIFAPSNDRPLLLRPPASQSAPTLICPSCQSVAIDSVDLTPKSPAHIALSRARKRDVSRSSRTLVRDAMDVEAASAFCARTNGAFADGEVVWFWRPDAGAKFVARSTNDGGKKARSPGRARRKPLKPLRRECWNDFGGPVATTLVCFFHFARGAMGAAGTRHSLRPPVLARVEILVQLGRKSRRERVELRRSRRVGRAQACPPCGAACCNGGHGANAPLPTLRSYASYGAL